jgi:VanZ family protein
MTTPPSSRPWRERFRLPALAAYVVVLLIATLIPFRGDPAAAHIAERLWRAFHPTLAGRDIVDGVRNVVLFAGWGVVFALTATGGVRGIVLRATGTGAAISIFVEGLQLFSSNRETSLLDVTTNTAGSFVGAVTLILLVVLANQRRTARSFVGVPALLFAGTYGAAVMFETVIPLFRQLEDPIARGGPFRRFGPTLAAFTLRSLVEFTASDLIIFLPAGALAVAALAEHGDGYPEARRRVIVWGTGLAIVGELLHGFLGQPVLLGAVLSHALAVAAGAVIAARFLPRLTVQLRGQRRPRALTILYMAILATWSWRPFLPEVTWAAIAAKFDSRWYMPLASLGGRVDFFSVSDVCAQFLLFLPLGGLLAIWPVRRHGALAGPLPAIWLAFFCEAMQTFVWERTLDVTVPLIQASAAVIGWAIVQRAGYRVYGETWPARPRQAPGTAGPSKPH